jgi:hypothetical protein
MKSTSVMLALVLAGVVASNALAVDKRKNTAALQF